MKQTVRAVSAERIFALLGCAVAAFAAVAILAELSSFGILFAYSKPHTDPLGAQNSPAYDHET